MGSVIPLKKSANSAYLELKNLLGNKLEKVESLIELKLKSEVNLIEEMSDHHLQSGGKRHGGLSLVPPAREAFLHLLPSKLLGKPIDPRLVLRPVTN